MMKPSSVGEMHDTNLRQIIMEGTTSEIENGEAKKKKKKIAGIGITFVCWNNRSMYEMRRGGHGDKKAGLLFIYNTDMTIVLQSLYRRNEYKTLYIHGDHTTLNLQTRRSDYRLYTDTTIRLHTLYRHDDQTTDTIQTWRSQHIY